MTYQYQFINRLDQFGQVSYDLILTDVEQILPDYRCTVAIDADSDTDDYKANLADQIIAEVGS